MSEGKIRGKILVDLWASEKPLTLQIISEKVGLNSASTMGYLLGLIKAQYVCVPEKHYYAITILGKQAIGLPKIDKTLAQKILCPTSAENAFHFYKGIDQPLGVQAKSLGEFVDQIQTLDMQSIEFHLKRKDFDCWVRSLGDIELSKKIGLLRATNLSKDNLRKELYQTVKSRCEELTKFVL